MTNAELMEKYGVSERTVTRWRKDGDPRVDMAVDTVDIPARVDTPKVDIQPQGRQKPDLETRLVLLEAQVDRLESELQHLKLRLNFKSGPGEMALAINDTLSPSTTTSRRNHSSGVSELPKLLAHKRWGAR